MGNRSFPNKRILRNNLCLPACIIVKFMVYIEKRMANAIKRCYNKFEFKVTHGIDYCLNLC